MPEVVRCWNCGIELSRRPSNKQDDTVCLDCRHKINWQLETEEQTRADQERMRSEEKEEILRRYSP